MRSHIGLFAEIMTADFLRKIAEKTTAPLYREHVTNYVYEHRNEFKTLFLPVPPPFSQRKDIRLTIDTPGDFDSIQKLYAELHHQNAHFSAIQLLEAIDQNPLLIKSMKEQIELNSK
jgi:spore coat polysaccharide biosynthesis protein SpsF